MSYIFNEENRTTTILRNNRVNDGIAVARDGQKEPRDSCVPAKGPTLRQGTSPGQPEYEVKKDTLGHFSTGQIITGSHYGSVKEEYDVRMKDWAGNSQPRGDMIYHISGGKRDQIKRFLEENRYVVTSEYYHYIVRAPGKRVDPVAILLKAQNMGLKCLWVHAVGETGPDRAPRKMRSA